MVVAEFSIVPLGTGADSLSEQVALAVQVVEDSGLPYQLTPMGTVLEGEWDDVMGVIRSAHSRLREVYPRVLTRIAIDDRDGALGRMPKKVQTVRERLRSTR